MFAEKIAEEILVKAVEDAFYSCAMEWAWTSDPDVLVECFEREIRRIAKEHVSALHQAIEEAEKEQQNFPQLLPDALEVPACTGYDLGNNEEIGYANGWNDFREDMILNFGLVPEANMPAAGTSEYGAWINAAKNKADMSFSHTGKDRFKWCCAFEQHLREAL